MVHGLALIAKWLCGVSNVNRLFRTCAVTHPMSNAINVLRSGRNELDVLLGLHARKLGDRRARVFASACSTISRRLRACGATTCPSARRFFHTRRARGLSSGGRKRRGSSFARHAATRSKAALLVLS